MPALLGSDGLTVGTLVANLLPVLSLVCLRAASTAGTVYCMIDLHVHTNISDGTYSPEEVILVAAEKGVTAIAITDHDSVGGVDRARNRGAAVGIEVVPGVEVSTHWDHGIMHMLGYFIDPSDSELLSTLNYLKNGRRDRIPRIVAKLKDCGIRISEDEVYELAVGGVPGRPHIANVLVQNKYVKSVQDAFDLYLKQGAPAYVNKTKLPPSEAINIIARSGGLPVLAHPYSLGEDDPTRLEAIVRELKDRGLRGIEVYYPLHKPDQIDLYLSLATDLDLAVTGGTDFHGSNKPGIELGAFPDGRTLSLSILEDLKARL
jgi:3',5'-nucleoside bisphosphate phosphatase